MGRILITGVAGFIGSNLAKHLLENEKNVVLGIDNFSSSTMSNLYPLLKKTNFDFIEHNLVENIEISADCIYHFAGNGDKKRYLSNKFDFMIEQIEIIKNIIKITQNNGARLILPTENFKYAQYNTKYHKYYDALKITQSLIEELINSNKINAVFAKLDYVYGENMQKNDERFIPTVINNALNNIDIKLEFDESFYFTYINDVIINLEKLMNNYSQETYVDIYNQSLYLKSDVARLIINYIKSQSKCELLTNEQYNPSYAPKNTILPNGTEFICKTPVLEGILKTIQNFKLLYYS